MDQENALPPQPARNILAFITGDKDRATELAAAVIAWAPANCTVVLAFEKETQFGNEWLASTWPNVYVLYWEEAGAHSRTIID